MHLFCLVLVGDDTIKCQQITIKDISSFLFGTRMASCDCVSPVKKSADDRHSHKQLNHQGQVDFPYKTCSEKKEKQIQKHRERWDRRKTCDNNNLSEWSIEAGKAARCCQKWLFSPNLHSCLSFKMICIVWEVKSCDRLWAAITEQFSIPNQFSRKHCKTNEGSKYCWSSFGSDHANRNAHFSRLLFLPLFIDLLPSTLTSPYGSITEGAIL